MTPLRKLWTVGGAVALLLPTLTGCGGGDSSAVNLQLSALSALGTGKRALWTRWVKVDSASVPDSTGSKLCTGSDAGTSGDVCVNGGLTRKVKIPGQTSCNVVEGIEDSLEVFQWNCVEAQDGSGLWIYSTAFRKGKGLSDLIEVPSSSTWREISVAIDTPAGRYQSEPSRVWSDSLTTAPDSSSGRASLGTEDRLYYLNSNTAGHGFSFSSDHVGLVVLRGSTYTYNDTDPDPVVELESRKFVYLEGAFAGGGSASNGVALTTDGTASSFAFLNGLAVSGASSVGILIGGEAYNLTLSNLEVSDNALDGIQRNGSGSYLRMSNIHAHDNDGAGVKVIGVDEVTVTGLESLTNGNIGLSLVNISHLTVTGATLSQNGDDGLNLINVDQGTFSNIETSENGQNGTNLVGDATDLNFGQVIASGNHLAGLLFGGGTTTSNIQINNVQAHDNGDHGLSFIGVQNISGAKVRADRNGEHGLNIHSLADSIAISDLSFNKTTKDGVHVGGGSTNISFTDVTSMESGNHGATITQSASVSINKLTISKAAQIGCNISPGAVATLESVTVKESGSHGLEINNAQADITGLSIVGAAGYGIFEHSGSISQFAEVRIEQIDDDAIFMENGNQSTYQGIYFDHITGYLISASSGAKSEFFDLEYGPNVDTLNLYNIDTGTGAEVDIP